MISKIVNDNGNKFINIDGKNYAPVAFRSFRPTPANISFFYNNGIKLYQMICTGKINCNGVSYSLFGEIWKGDKIYDFTAFDNQMEMFLKFAPDGYYCVMIQLDTRDWFLEKYNCPDSFKNLGQACFYDEWISAAKDYLKSFIEYAEEKYGDRIFCYSFSVGLATEGFTEDKGAYDKVKEKYFKKYMKDEGIQIPTRVQMDEADEFVREENSIVTNYFKFTSEKCAGIICDFAECAKKAMDNKKLVGLFYGYMMLESELQNRWCTTSYEKVWRNENIDMIFSPAAYFEYRFTENPAAY